MSPKTRCWMILFLAAALPAFARPSLDARVAGHSVFVDADGDGLRDRGEAGIAGVEVHLRDAQGRRIATALTDADGRYAFDPGAGRFAVEVAADNFRPGGVLAGYEPTAGQRRVTANIANIAEGAVLTHSFGFLAAGLLSPILECVADNGDGTWTAHFGYRSNALGLLAALVGADNAFSPGPADRGQPTSFVPGRTYEWPYNDFSVVFDGNDLTWTLGGASVTANRGSVPCSHRVFVRKEWVDTAGNVLPGPPAGLPGNFAIIVRGPLGTATCTYPAGSPESSPASTATRPRRSTTAGSGCRSAAGSRSRRSTCPPAAWRSPAPARSRARAPSAPPWAKLNVGSATGASTLQCTHTVRNAVGPAPREAQPGTGTLGYWKNHEEAWPVEQITAGGVTRPKAQAIRLMGTAGKGDKTYDLFKQLVAAKLNVLIGNDASCIGATVAAADAWLLLYPLGSGKSSAGVPWLVGGPLHQKLDDYNNGRLCAPHRD